MTDEKLKQELDEISVLIRNLNDAKLRGELDIAGAVDWKILMTILAALAPLLFSGNPELGALIMKIIELFRGLFAN